MPSKWPETIQFEERILKVEDQICQICQSKLIIRKDRIHRIERKEGPLKLICKLSCCSNKQCPERKTLINPKSEIPITMPRWRIGWDLFLWMGFRRFKRHWSVPQIQNELKDHYHINLSTDLIIEYLRKYQVMVAAKYQDISVLKEEYQNCQDVILTIDGLQPEKGHETLYVVRELKKQRIWFAESLLSSTNAEVLKLIQRAKQLAEQLNKPVRGWVSDKQEAFVAAIALEFPSTPHRYCNNHFLRDLAKPVLEKDSHAKVQMRKKVRGLRRIEKETLAEQEKVPQKGQHLNLEQRKYASDIVLDYCVAIRGVLNDNHGGPLEPPGLRMFNALSEISKSLEHNLKQGKTPIRSKLKRLNDYIKRGLKVYQPDKPKIVRDTSIINRVFNTLDSKSGSLKKRLSQFKRLKNQFANTDDPIKMHLFTIMQSFEPGLFVGSDDLEIPPDNLDLERWLSIPKGHERKIHGHQHAGIRIVHEGPTLLPVLDVHLSRTEPFTYQDLLPYIDVKAPQSQTESIKRHRIMKRASSKKKELIYWKI